MVGTLIFWCTDFQARMEEALKGCWNAQKLMQSSHFAILTNMIVDLNASSAVARHQRIENMAVMEYLIAQNKDNVLMTESFKKVSICHFKFC